MRALEWRDNLIASFGCHGVGHNDRATFLRDVEVVGDCWLWRGAPKTVIGGKSIDPQLAAYAMLVRAYNPAVVSVSASCGNPLCCAPHHLKMASVSRETRARAA